MYLQKKVSLQGNIIQCMCSLSCKFADIYMCLSLWLYSFGFKKHMCGTMHMYTRHLARYSMAWGQVSSFSMSVHTLFLSSVSSMCSLPVAWRNCFIESIATLRWRKGGRKMKGTQRWRWWKQHYGKRHSRSEPNNEDNTMLSSLWGSCLHC